MSDLADELLRRLLVLRHRLFPRASTFVLQPDGASRTYPVDELLHRLCHFKNEVLPSLRSDNCQPQPSASHSKYLLILLPTL